MRSFRRGAACASFLLLALLVVPAGAGALTVTSMSSGYFYAIEQSAETNDLTVKMVGSTLEFRDAGALLQSSSMYCTPSGSTPADRVVSCTTAPDPTYGDVTVVVAAGAGNDKVALDTAQGMFRGELHGGDGSDQLTGAGGNDSLTGATSSSESSGDDGSADTLDGGSGPDYLFGGKGADTLKAADGQADNRVDCGSDADVAYFDSVDSLVFGCETHNPAPDPGTGGGGDAGGGGGTAPPPPAPRPTALPTLSADPAPGVTVTCNPGSWTGDPSFEYQWILFGGQANTVRVAGSGATYTPTMAHVGLRLMCVVTATNPSGTFRAGTQTIEVAHTFVMPDLRGKTRPVAQKKLLELTGGAVDFGTEAEQARRGKALDSIPCEFGGTRESKSTCKFPARWGKAKPGQIYKTDPKAGTPVVARGTQPGRVIPEIALYYYDPLKDERLPALKPGKWGRDCPLHAATIDQRTAFLDSLLSLYEAPARDTVTKRECLLEVKYKDVVGQELDPYVTAVDVKELNKDDKAVVLTISRPKYADLAVVLFHKRLVGRDSYNGVDLSRGPINPTIGTDGKLTVGSTQREDLCFHVIEASSGRGAEGVRIQGVDPGGAALRTPSRTQLQYTNTDRNGDACATWSLYDEGTYTFTFVRRGANGINQEGVVKLVATDRSHKPWQTTSGRKIAWTAGQWVQTGWSSAKASAAADPLATIRGWLSSFVGALSGVRIPFLNPAGVGAAGSALGAGDAQVSLYNASHKATVTPGFLTIGGKTALSPSLTPPGTQTAPRIIAGGAGNIVATDGATIIAGGAGNIVATDGATIVAGGGGNLVMLGGRLIGQDGSSLIANDGATIVSGGGGNIIAGGAGNLIGQDGNSLIGQDGSSLRSPSGGNVIQPTDGRSFMAGPDGSIPKAAIIAGGAGNLIPIGR